MSQRANHPTTPDGRYFVVDGRLWRLSNPALPEAERQWLVSELMTARRAVKTAKGDGAALARRAVDFVKRELGERGPVWWTDGTPDFNRHLVKNTSYADWYRQLAASQRTPMRA